MIFDDQILIKRIQNGDKESLGQLIEKYYGDVFSLCFYKTKDRHLAEDLTQETFIRLIDHIYSFKPKGKFRNYLYTITLNVCRDEFKKQNRNQEVDIEEFQNYLYRKEDSGSEDEQMIEMYLDQLPDYQKDVIILHYYQDLKLREIAGILNVSESTVKSRLYQGLNKLRKIYEEENKNE